ncbi:MAG TPA: hypothetical protein VIM27_12315 [Gaiellales bacterium]
MPDELEERLERALAAIPPAGEDATGRALRAALAAVPPAAETRRRRRRRLLVPAAACTVAFVFGGVTLAATGGHLPLVGPSPKHHHPTPVVVPARNAAPVLPRGAIAFSATADGRAWLATSAGASLHGRPLSALALSPGAVYLLEAKGRTLQAVRVPDFRTAFTRGVTGTAAATAWAPAGIRIAYVVRADSGNRLYDMWGNGTHLHLVATHTNGQAPSWRWDSLAFAYIRADGTVMVHNPTSGATSALPRGCGIRHPAAVAFAPFGGLLAIADRSGRVRVVDTLHHSRGLCASGNMPGIPRVAWLQPRQLLVGAGTTITRYVVNGPAGGVDVTNVPGRVAGLAAAPGGRRIALALRDAEGNVRVVEAYAPRFSEESSPLRVSRTLLELSRITGPVALTWQ